ncbi:hypothetical protein ACHQM5_021425 [Ranunculus cassubicifolius]
MAVSEDFIENDKESLLDIDSNKELWLIQWPSNQIPEFDGQEVTLKLDADGTLGTFTSSSGKAYELVSFASQEPDATVFQSDQSGSKVVGKISRRVSVIHYQEPSELEQLKPEEIYQKSITSSSSRQRRSSMSQYTQSMFQPGSSGSAKRSRRNNDRVGSANQGSEGRDQSGVTSLGSVGRDQSGVTSTGSAGSSGRKSKKVKEEEY